MKRIQLKFTVILTVFFSVIQTGHGQKEDARDEAPPRDPLSYIEDQKEAFFAEKKAAHFRGTSTLDRDVKRYIEENHEVNIIYPGTDDDSDDFLDHRPGQGYSGTWVLR
jgi:hypothetical protein